VFAQALTEIVRRLDDAKARHLLDQYALIGGFAVSAWGAPRATHDVDFALALGSSDAAALACHLRAEFQPGEPDDPLRGIFRTSVTVDDLSVPIQLVLLPPAWNALIFREVESLLVFGCTVRVVSWQALILLKLYAGGPQDMLDAQQILAVRQPTQVERQAVAALADAVGLSAAWQTLINR
jgi:predicted nucleotidyltransferase